MIHCKIPVILIILFNYSLVSGQKLDKPVKISKSDFEVTNFTQPTVLTNNLLVTFPYKGADYESGALDKLFSLKIDAVLRTCFNLNESNKHVLLLPEIFNNEPYINSIIYYYKQGSNVIEEKVKKSEYILIKDSIGYYLDCSPLIKHENSVLDIYFTCRINESRAKKHILFYLDRFWAYKEFSAQIVVPEIYAYRDSLRSTSTNIIIKKGLLGPVIGYRSTSSSSRNILSKVLADSFARNYGLSYAEVNCENHLISITLKDEFKNVIWNSNKPIIGLSLSSITEIE